MLERFTRKALQALRYAEETARHLEHGYIGTEHLLVGLLKEESSVAANVLMAHGVTADEVIRLIQELIAPVGGAMVQEGGGYTPRARRILEQSALEASKMDVQLVGTEHILMVLLRDADCDATKLLNTMKVDIRKVYAELYQVSGHKEPSSSEGRKENRGRKATGMQTLERYARNLTEMAKQGKLDPVIGREDEIRRVIQILSRRTKNNPCLIGEPGVGKTAVVEGLARWIVSGEVPEAMKEKQLFMLDLPAMVAGTKYRGEFEERIKNLIDEVRQNKDVLLFIDELHTIIGAGGSEGALDASNILKPCLARGEIQLVGATTITEYRKYIEKDAALERRFQPVMVEEPTEAETYEILQGLRPAYEAHHGVTITDEALKTTVKLATRYINDRFLPDKAIDLMDEAASKVRLSFYTPPEDIKEMETRLKQLAEEKESCISQENYEKAGVLRKEQLKLQAEIRQLQENWEQEKQTKSYVVEAENIADVVSEWTKIPVKSLEENEIARLKQLENILHGRVIGQEEAVSTVAKSIRRGRVGLKNPRRPIGSFLFLGPTGVGKTELSKALAEAVFGTEQALLRVDMTEYMEKHSVSKMIGSPPGYVGYDEGGQLSEKVRRNPYSIVLFDEIEKAHPDVFNILLQVLDDGQITDSQGRKVDFRNTIIIMTSNCGAASIVSPKRMGFGATGDEKANYEFMKTKVLDEVKKQFKPEFLNRIDAQIVFHSLSKDHMISIADILLAEICQRVKEQMDMELVVDMSAKQLLVELGWDEKYGARPLRRVLQSRLEDKLAEEILEENIKQGDRIVVSAEGQELIFHVQKNDK